MEKAQVEELAYFLGEHNASESSKKAYITRYKRLIRGATDIEPLRVPIHKATESDIIAYIRRNSADSSSPPEVKRSLALLATMIRRLYDKPTDLLVRFTNDMNEARKVETHKQALVLNDELSDISVDDLRDHMMSKFKKDDYIGYMINYLLITFGVRNADLNVTFVESRDKLNNTQNFLYKPNKSSIQYIRNDYKTAKIYGQKIYTIKDKLFIKCYDAMMAGGFDYILMRADGRRLNMNSIGAYVKRYTYPHEFKKADGSVKSVGLTESDIFKIIIRDIGDDIELLKQYEMSRGTSPAVVTSNYKMTLE